MNREWIAMEHYRLHAMEQWPDSPKKTAGLAAVRSSLESMGAHDFECLTCGSRRLIALPNRPAPIVVHHIAA